MGQYNYLRVPLYDISNRNELRQIHSKIALINQSLPLEEIHGRFRGTKWSMRTEGH